MLNTLNIEGCKKLHRLPPLEGSYSNELCTNKTFPFIKTLRFEYHAHCCLFRDFRPLVEKVTTFDFNAQCPDTYSNSNEASKRAIRSTKSYVCIHYSNGSVFTMTNSSPEADQIYQLDELCELIPYCFQNRCFNNCAEEDASIQSGEMEGIACVEDDSFSISASPSITQTISKNSDSDSNIAPSTTKIIKPSPISLTVTTVVCWKGSKIVSSPGTSGSFSVSPTEQSLCQTSVSPSSDVSCASVGYSSTSKNTHIQCSTLEVVVTPSVSSSIICPSITTTANIPSTSKASTAILTPSTSLTPTTPPSSITDCLEYPDGVERQDCILCTDNDCVSEDVDDKVIDCGKYLAVCNAKRKRSIDCLLTDCLSGKCSEFKHLCKENRYRRNAPLSCSAVEVLVTPSISFSIICPSITKTIDISSTLKASTATLTPSTSLTPTTPPSPITDCLEYPDGVEREDCILCTDNDCVSEDVDDKVIDCDKYLAICHAKRKRSIDCLLTDCLSGKCSEFKHLCKENRYRRSAATAAVCDVSVILDYNSLIPTTSTQTSMSSATTSISSGASTTTIAPLVDSPSPTNEYYCSPSALIPGSFRESENFSSCYPGNDPFNPCFNILDDDILRGAIWIVLLIAIGGNGLVIVVTLLHWASRYRSYKKEPNLLYILYLNLAIADLFMGLYLITIAVTDVQTKGHYATEAIEWQTGSGCFFAGFCAIFSSILSVYTLLVITLERVYSIKFALENKHFKKHWVFIIMIFGWVVAIVLGLLPLAGLSSYDRVSICLPFENRGDEDKAYIALILILTGLASFVILFSYIYLFYIVGCSANKRRLTRSLSGKEELKLALRMSMLILTDFATWGPIAFFGLTAAFGVPLVDIKAAKVLMVFVFPLNSCLNPILYSFSTRLFRNNINNLFKTVGLCKLCDHYKAAHTTSAKSTSQYRSKDDPQVYYHGRRRSTQISILSRLTSIGSYGNDSAGSRRGSTFSGGSIEEGTTFRANSLKPSTPPDIDMDPLTNGITIRSMKVHRDSASSLPGLTRDRLKVVVEEDEVENNHMVDIRRKDSIESNGSFSIHYVGNEKIEGTSKNAHTAERDSNVAMRRQSLPTILDSQENPNFLKLELFGPLNSSKNVTSNEENGVLLTNLSSSREEIQMAEISFL